MVKICVKALARYQYDYEDTEMKIKELEYHDFYCFVHSCAFYLKDDHDFLSSQTAAI